MTTSVNSVREQVVQAARAWVVHVTGLAATKVIVGGDSAPRPAMPYSVVTMIAPPAPVGTTDLVRSVDANGWLFDSVRGYYRSTVQVDVFGRTAADLLERLVLCVDLPTAQAVVAAYDVGISRIVGARNGMVLRDTAYEEHGVLDLEVVCAVETLPAAAAHAEHVGWTVTLDRTPNPPPDLTETGTYDLPVPTPTP